MKPFFLTPENYQKASQLCCQSILDGKIVLIPTDTIHGLSCNYFNPLAREKLIELKQRPMDKSFIVLLPNIKSLNSFADQDISRSILDILPAPLTLIVKNRHQELYQEKTLAIRIPKHPWLQIVLNEIQVPLVSTSANISGEKEVNTPEELIQQFQDKVNLIIIDSNLRAKAPSTILDISQKPFRIVRQGDYHISNSLLQKLNNDLIEI